MAIKVIITTITVRGSVGVGGAGGKVKVSVWGWGVVGPTGSGAGVWEGGKVNAWGRNVTQWGSAGVATGGQLW